jgi:hypothetical protein
MLYAPVSSDSILNRPKRSVVVSIVTIGAWLGTTIDVSVRYEDGLSLIMALLTGIPSVSMT